MSCFEGDINFCPECGNILPVPGLQDFIACPRCAFKIPTREIEKQVIRSSVVFNPLEKTLSAVQSDEDSELKGPVVDRRCSRCNKEGMVYHTRQMRSADEGQTVFFTCIHCSTTLHLLTVPKPLVNGLLTITVLNWPANSPDLNPIENLWDIVKRKLRRKIQHSG